MPPLAYKLETIDGAIETRHVSQVPVTLGDALVSGGTFGSCRIYDSDITSGTPPTADLVANIVPDGASISPLPAHFDETALSKGLVILTVAATKFSVQWRPALHSVWGYHRFQVPAITLISSGPAILGPMLLSRLVGVRDIKLYDQNTAVPDAAKLKLTIDIAATKLPPIPMDEWSGMAFSEGLLVDGEGDLTVCWRPSP